MYLCSYKRDFQINGRKLYDDLFIRDILSFSDFYIENEALVIDKTGSNASDLDFWLKLTDALKICKRYVPEQNAKRVLLKLQRYRRIQLKEIESGYYVLRDRVKQLEAELEEQKKLVETLRCDKEKAELADAFLKSKSTITASEFNVYLRQNGVAKITTTMVFKGLTRLGWINNDGAIWHVPTSKGIDGGYVRLEQDVENTRPWHWAPVVITPKGQSELLKYFKRLVKKENKKTAL